MRKLYPLLAAVDAALAATGRSRARRISKPLLMPALLVGCDAPSRRALALGGVGDVALLGEGDGAFLVGLGSFLAGHLAWIVALRGRPDGGRLRDRPAAALPHLVAFAGLNAYLWPRTGSYRVPVVAYSAALLGMSLVAMDSRSPRTAAGGALFLLSDALLALERFGGVRVPGHEGLVMITYCGAQGLLAEGGRAG